VATFCLIHGNWHDGSSWDRMVGPLRERGHEVLAPDLPFDDPKASFEQRAAPALTALEKVDDHVVVVGHSGCSGYAAFVADRTPGSLLVHLCPRLAPFPPPGGAPAPFREGFPFPPADAEGVTVWDPEEAIKAMYGRLPPEAGRALAERLLPGAPAPEYPLPAHPEVPTELIYAAEDELFEPEWERLMAREVLGVEPIEIPGGHFPMVEDPEALASLLDRLARKHAPD
jgi:pimeloyl-ACP methyl ester carboxylesterase